MKLFFTISLLAAIFQLAVAFPTPLKQTEQDGAQNGDKPFVANPEERGGYFEGDMIIDEDQLNQLKSGVVDEGRRWPNRTLVYKLMDTWTPDELVKIKKGVDLISSRTCIKFREITDTEGVDHYVAVYNPPSGCSSEVGLQYDGPPAQELKLQGGEYGCFSNKGTVAHEFIHALGFHHEQSRTDRDRYITIIKNNIKKGHQKNFIKYSSEEVTDFDVPYDYGSVMHYGRDAFGREVNGKKAQTIRTTVPGVEIGQRRELSDLDFDKLNAMYPCP